MLRNNKVRPFLLCGVAALYACAISANAEDSSHTAAKVAPTPSAKAAAPAAHVPTAMPGAAPVARGGVPAAAGAVAPAAHNGQPQQYGHADAAHHDMERHDEHHEMQRHEEHREMEHREARREHYEFHGRDVNRFDRAEMGRWRGGRWNNSCYSGRCGWWWFSSGQWYFYDQPVYPYPMAVSEVIYLEPAEPVAEVVMEPAVQAPPPPPPAPLPAAPQFWYYCDNPAGYYPSVPSCPAGFREVAAPRQ